MSDTSQEPGVNLGRMIAAERNAVTGATLGKENRQELGALIARIEKLEAEVVALKQENVSLRGRVFAANGGTVGATA